jgi:hypothetical protein
MTSGPSEADDAVDAADPGGSGFDSGSGEAGDSTKSRVNSTRGRNVLIVVLVASLVLLVELALEVSNQFDPPECEIVQVLQGGVRQ